MRALLPIQRRTHTALLTCGGNWRFSSSQSLPGNNASLSRLYWVERESGWNSKGIDSCPIILNWFPLIPVRSFVSFRLTNPEPFNWIIFPCLRPLGGWIEVNPLIPPLEKSPFNTFHHFLPHLHFLRHRGENTEDNKLKLTFCGFLLLIGRRECPSTDSGLGFS